MSKQCKVFLIRRPLDPIPYQVVKTQNLATPEVGVYATPDKVKELCADPTIEVEITICEVTRRN